MATRVPILADRPSCTGEDPELWFAGERQPWEQSEAMAFCFVCPQSEVCLQRALRDEAELPANAIFGIFGGKHPDERYALLVSRAS